MKTYIKYFRYLYPIIFFSGCELSNQKLTKIDGFEVDKRFFDTQAIKSTDSEETKEFKRMLLNKKFYRVYPYIVNGQQTTSQFSNYFSDIGAQKSANIDDNGKEYDVTFEQFKIVGHHIRIEYYNPIECDLQGKDENGVITLKCTDGTWKLAPSLKLAKENMSDCQTD